MQQNHYVTGNNVQESLHFEFSEFSSLNINQSLKSVWPLCFVCTVVYSTNFRNSHSAAL